MSVATTSVSGAHALPISWNNLTYSVGQREILRGLSGAALPSRTLAIMGSSGAGKTTFLNAISARLREDGDCRLTGERLLGDVPFEYKYRKLLAFVTQDDIVSATTTPYDALYFSLRIRRGTDPEATDRKVNAMLEELNLTAARNTIVGVPGLIAGLSGGERKRTNIGVELVTDPKVLLLDEPTTGLDSVTSVKIAALLSELARKGRTVVYTIHQPTADVLRYFDDLMLLTMGRVAYHGTMEGAVEYFAGIGYECPEHYTPTDYFMILLQDDAIAPKLIEEWAKHYSAQMEANIASPHMSPVAATTNIKESETRAFMDDYISRHKSTFAIQAKELIKRAMQGTIRNKPYIAMLTIQALFFAIIVSLIFANLEDDVQGIQDRQGLLFMVAINRGFSGVFMMVNTFFKEKEVFIREQQAASYSPGLYFLSKAVSEFPVQLITCFLECVIIYFSTVLVVDAGRFFHYFAIIFAVFQTAAGLGLAISATVSSFQLASALAPLLIVPMMMAAGLMANTDRLHPYWWWLEKISFVRYGFVLLAHNEFGANQTYTCDVAELGADFCSRQNLYGQAVLDNGLKFNTSHDSVWAMWMSLAIMFVFTRILAVASLYRVAQTKA